MRGRDFITLFRRLAAASSCTARAQPADMASSEKSIAVFGATIAGILFSFAIANAAPALADTRVALVVGNSAYKNINPLENPANDARLIADTLHSLGFALVGGGPQLDLDKADFDSAVQAFGRQLQGADVGLFYYAGHGVQVRGENYLVPVGASPTKEADVDFQMLSTNLVLRQMDGAGTKLNIVILDACRNNPFGQAGLRATNGGLAEMRAPEGTLISFATQPGNVALDGASGDSPFSNALAATIKRPGLDIFRVFNEVGLAVASATGGAQQPWISVSPIKGDFYFTGPPAGTEAHAPENSAAQVWAVTQNATSQAVLQDFIRQFGDTPYGAMARARLDELRKDRIAAAPANVEPQTAPSPSLAQPQAQSLKQLIDPVLVGTFERHFVADDFDWRFIYSIAPDGNYRLTETQTEDGTFQAANGMYRTVNSQTGRVRTGLYRAAGASAIEVVNSAGSAIFRPLQQAMTINPVHPVMLGVWRATAVQSGVTWMLTIENNPDGTYHYEARSEDTGSFVGSDHQWRATSALSRKAGKGTYRAVDSDTIEIVDANGPVIWRRQ